MKIILAIRIPPHLDQYRKSNQEIPPQQFQWYWLQALQSLGHDVTVFRYTDSLIVPQRLKVSAEILFEKMNPILFAKYRLAVNRLYNYLPENKIRSLQLIKLLNLVNPQVIIFGGGISELTNSVIREAKKLKIKTAVLSGEDPLISATSFERNHAANIDLFVTNDPINAEHWQNLGASQAICLPYAAIDPGTHAKIKLSKSDQKKYSSDVVFIGTLFAKRQRELLPLIHQKFKLAIYGYVLPEAPLLSPLKPYYRGQAWGRTITKIYNATKIALNFIPNHLPQGANLRLFEILGCGALEITNHCQDRWYKSNKEIILFNNPTDLTNKITYFLNHPQKRQTVANAGFYRTHKEHTYPKRFQEILSFL